MHIHPAIQALQGDPALQAKAQQAAHDGMFAWVDAPERRQLRAELDAFAARRPIADCPLLARLFAQGDRTARDLAMSFADAGIAILADEPFAHLPQRHSTDGLVSVLVLGRSGNVTLTLCAIDGERLAAGAPARHAAFWPGESWEHVLAGEAVADLVDCHPRAEDGSETGAVALHAREVLLTPGAVIARDADRQAMLLRSVPRSLVTLRLQRRLSGAGPSREYALANGALAHQSAGNPRDSRIELMMALLGRMKRVDAAPLIARIAAAEGSAALRWQALREGLALDTATGFAALCRVAADPGDSLAEPAGALRAQLIEAHPALAGVVPCPA